jgi:anti-anti-sigma factor
MYNFTQENDEIHFELSSRLYYVDRGVNDCKTYLKESGFREFSDLILIIREMLINAIEHGNRNNIEREVACTIKNRGKGRFKVVVEDEGEGFEYNRLNLSLPKSGDRGRRCGYPLIYALSDMIKFNERGNQITAFITLPLKIDFHVEYDELKVMITPSGDLTATSADEFRAILMKLFDKGHTLFSFDLKKVHDIDSISLGVFFSFGKMLKDTNELNGNKSAKPLLENVEKRLSDFFILTGLDQLYEINTNGKET